MPEIVALTFVCGGGGESNDDDEDDDDDDDEEEEEEPGCIVWIQVCALTREGNQKEKITKRHCYVDERFLSRKLKIVPRHFTSINSMVCAVK